MKRIADEIEIFEYYPACIIDDSLVIADVHLGYEEAMSLDGTSVFHRQIDDLKRVLELIFEESGVDRLVINGDLKHTFERATPEEWEDLPEFIEKALEYAKEIILVRGNHDTILGPLKRYKRVRIVDELNIGDLKLVHGHKMVGGERLLIAHEHPVVLLGDRVGARIKVPCFLHSEELRLTVMPAFSPIVGGTPINLLARGEFLSPILNESGVDEMKVFCIDEETGMLEFPELKRWRDISLNL